MLASLAGRVLPTILTELPTGLLSITNMINAIEYRNVKVMVSI